VGNPEASRDAESSKPGLISTTPNGAMLTQKRPRPDKSAGTCPAGKGGSDITRTEYRNVRVMWGQAPNQRRRPQPWGRLFLHSAAGSVMASSKDAISSLREAPDRQQERELALS